MCFNINPQSKKEKTLWQATENIVCYKVVIKKADNNLYGYYQSSFRYKKNELMISDLYIPKNGNLITKKDKLYDYDDSIKINEGFHSYKSLDITENSGEWRHFSFDKNHIVRCVIPKGSLFYENVDEYVSNQLIIKEIVQ